MKFKKFEFNKRPKRQIVCLFCGKKIKSVEVINHIVLHEKCWNKIEEMIY